MPIRREYNVGIVQDVHTRPWDQIRCYTRHRKPMPKQEARYEPVLVHYLPRSPWALRFITVVGGDAPVARREWRPLSCNCINPYFARLVLTVGPT